MEAVYSPETSLTHLQVHTALQARRLIVNIMKKNLSGNTTGRNTEAEKY
jgi:hypothetical protein